MIVRELVTMFGFDFDKKSKDKVDKEVDDSLTDLVRKLKRAAVVTATGAAVKYIYGIAEGVGALGSDIDTAAGRIGVGAEALQELQFAADRAYVSNQELTVGLKSLAKNAYAAANGSSEMSASFQLLGVSVKDAEGNTKPLGQLVEESADGFSRLSSDVEKSALAQKLFGDSGLALLPMFAKGSQGIRDMRQQAHDLGAVMGDEMIALGSKWDESNKNLATGIQGLKFALGKALLPSMLASNEALTAFIKAHGEMIRAGIAKTFHAIGIAAESVWRILRAVGLVAKGVYKVFAFFGPVLGTALALLSALAIAIIYVGTTSGLTGLVMAASWLVAFAPLVLAIAAIAAVGAAIWLIVDDIMAFGDGAESVTGDVVEWFQEMINSIKALWRDLKEWFPGFVEEMFVALLVAWENLKENLRSTVIPFYAEIVDALLAPFRAFFDTLRDWWDSYWGEVKASFGAVVDSIFGSFNKIVSMGQRVLGAFGFNASGGGGVSAAPAAVGKAPMALANTQSSSINVSVDAKGASNPEEVGAAVARQVDMVLEARNREALGALTVGAM